MAEVTQLRNLIRIGAVVRWLVAIILCVIAVLPIWWMVNVVFAEPGAGLSLAPRLYPTSIPGGIENIQTVLSDGRFVASFLNSIIYATLTTVLVLALASACAYQFAHFEFPGRNVVYVICLVGLMLPLATIIIPAQRLVVAIGWLNTIQGIVVPTSASAFALFFLTEYMRAVPKELFEAARVDGVGNFGIYWRIAVPVVRNGLLTVGILIFIMAWASYLWPLVVATNGKMAPISVQVSTYFMIGSKYPTNIVMTAALLSAIPVVAFYIAFNRLVVDGIARSGITG